MATKSRGGGLNTLVAEQLGEEFFFAASLTWHRWTGCIFQWLNQTWARTDRSCWPFWSACRRRTCCWPWGRCRGRPQAPNSCCSSRRQHQSPRSWPLPASCRRWYCCRSADRQGSWIHRPKQCLNYLKNCSLCMLE